MWHCIDCSVDFAVPLELEHRDPVLHSSALVFLCPECGSVKIEKVRQEVS
jgi:predicted RNA-binding Zn-ribbon protein involved in translation (DUF1610 family)